MPNYKALVIDYEPRGIRQLREPLENAGFEVHVAQDGEAGRRAFDRLKPDIALIEAMLPKRHGFDLCADLKKTPHGSKTPIVIVTSVYRGRKYRSQALHQYGCDEFMEKPVEGERLLATVHQLIERARGLEPHGLSEAPAGRPEGAPSEPLADRAAAARADPAESGASARDPGEDTENAEDEISRKLDELLGGGDPSGTPQAAIHDPRPFDSNVLRFAPHDTRQPEQSTESPLRDRPPQHRIVTASGGEVHPAYGHAAAAARAPRRSLEPEPAPRRPYRSRADRMDLEPRSSTRLRLLVMFLVLIMALAILSELVQG